METRLKKDGTPWKKMGRPPFGRHVTTKTQKAIAWLKEHPEASIRDAAAMFDIDHACIVRYIRRNQAFEDHIKHCPVCQQPMRSKRAIANVYNYIKSHEIEEDKG